MTPSISNNLLTIFGGCVFHILLPKILRLLIKKGLLKILVWRQNAPLNFLLKEGCSLLRVPEDIFFLSIPMFRGDAASTRCEALHKTEGTEKRATKNVQLVLQHCCKTSWIAMLRVLPPTFKPVNNLICCKTGFMWVVKRAISLFNLFYSNVAKQVARFLLSVFPYLS